MVLKSSIFLLAITVACSFTQFAGAGEKGQFSYPARKSPVPVAKSFEEPMKCIVKALEGAGYQPRDIGCFGFRPKNASAHPTGHACDVDQTGRNIARVNSRFGPSNRNSGQVKLAQGCKAVSGCIWRNPDCGHFEAISAPYSPAGTAVNGHYYGEKYAPHPVKRRR